MSVDPFTERLARVRNRYVSTIESKINDTYAELPKLVGDGPDVTMTLEETYRRIHGIVGIGLAVGFAATGKAAKTVENVLFEPHRDARGLGANEVDALKQALDVLRETVQRDLQTITTSGR
jgi:chemotaxis protein histidine kinase CheA